MTSKVVLITGAASGIGLAVASMFARRGEQVIISDINAEQAERVAEMIRNNGGMCEAKGSDVTVDEQLNRVVDQIDDQYGRLDVLINNAGIQYVANIEQFPTDTFRKMIDIMLVAPFVATKKVFPIMKKQGSGRIINMASINGLVGFMGKAAYNSAKHGIIGLTKVTALEGASQGITVNALCPGYVDTPLVRNQLQDLAESRGVPLETVLEEVIYPLVPQKRLISPDEVAEYAYFLCGDSGRGITGQAVVIDGGYTAQ